jgi:hypothetical protein
MQHPLHPTIAAYVAASNARDPEKLASCFTPEAIVRDEGETYHGPAGVSRWIAHTFASYVFSIEPLDAATEADRTVLTSRLTGNFPGSPVDLRFTFRLEDDHIVSLEIAP